MTTPHRTRPALARLVVPACFVALLGAAGCGQAQEKAQAKASQVASQVATAAAQQAAAAVKEQICTRVADGTVSDEDRAFLGGLVETSQKAGLPTEVTDPLRAIVASDRKVPPQALDQLRTACAE